MKQMLLDLQADSPPRLDNFIAGDNAAAVHALEQAVAGDAHVYVWGEPGCGRTHLLRAAVAAAQEAGRPARWLHAGEAESTLPETPTLLLAVDDIEQLSEAARIALFNSFNRARERHQTLILAGNSPPRTLDMREDLRTRIGQCVGFELVALDDATRGDILTMLARRRGMDLGEEITAFLLRHGRRDLPSLIRVLDALDRASLERKRPVTLPLLRDLIQLGLEI